MIIMLFSFTEFVTVSNLSTAKYPNDPKFSDRQFGETVQTQMRLLLKEESDLSLHCFLFHFQHLEVSQHGRTS